MLERAIIAISQSAEARTQNAPMAVDPRFQLIVALAYIAACLSIPLNDPASLLWMLCYPIVMAEALGIGYARVLAKSAWALPVFIAIGIFNPLLDKAPVWTIGHVVVSRGWLTFASLIIRGLLSMQALILLIDACGFYGICRALQALRCPDILVTQLLMLYRYSAVLLQEALNMQRARQSRGFGRKSYPLKMWGTFVGELMLRAMRRARRVHNAMCARGFEGTFRFSPYSHRLNAKDWAYLIAWIAIFAILRFVNLTAIAANLI